MVWLMGGFQLHEEMKRIMKTKYNIDISCYKDEFLFQKLQVRMTQNGIDDISDYLLLIDSNEMEVQRFMTSLNISYSEFFRDPFVYHMIEKQVISNILKNKTPSQEIRIWSVGCADGQEPYSIAMLFSDYFKKHNKKNKVRIFATDNSDSALECGRNGIYSRAELNNISLHHLDEYFTKHDDVFVIADNIKASVTFLKYNVLDLKTITPPESIYGDFDLILCRNVLIYYNASHQIVILDKLKKSLKSEGFLVTGESEMTNVETYFNIKPQSQTGAVFKIE